MTIYDYTRLYWNILVYSSKGFKDSKKSVTLRQTDTQTEGLTGPDLERHVPLKKSPITRIQKGNFFYPMSRIILRT